MKKLILFIFIFPLALYAADIRKVESLIINKKYQEVSNILQSEVHSDWKGYYYQSISSFELNDINRALLSGVKSLMLNPASSFNLSNLYTINNKFAQKYLPILRIHSLVKLALVISLIFMTILVLIFSKKKYFSLVLSFLQIGVITCIYSIPSISRVVDLSSISFQKRAETNLVRVSPSSDSILNKEFSPIDILFIQREIEGWVLVESLDGALGWVNKKNLIILPK